MDEDSLMKILFTGEKRVAVLGKKLTKGEANKIAEADSSTPREHIFANEAIALVVAKDFALKDISYSALQQYLQQNDAPYNFIFEEQNKGTLKYVLNNMAIAKPSAKLYAKNSLDSLINYVSKDNQAIGFINLAQISDEYSARTKAILNQVNVLPISIVDSTKKVLLTTPFQSDISTHQYPLVRPINFILGNTYNVVSVGFVNFLFKPKAAKVFLKAGLMPIKHPGREFIVNTESLKNN